MTWQKNTGHSSDVNIGVATNRKATLYLTGSIMTSVIKLGRQSIQILLQIGLLFKHLMLVNI